jgi:hypothetical protein
MRKKIKINQLEAHISLIFFNRKLEFFLPEYDCYTKIIYGFAELPGDFNNYTLSDPKEVYNKKKKLIKNR